MKKLLAIALASAACSTTSADVGNSGLVPLKVRTSSSGSARFSAWVQIGNDDPFEAMLDTGSSGLRVLPDVVSDGAFASSTAELVSASFHSGLALQGTMAYGTVTLGGLVTPQAIPIMRVDAIGCTPAVPDCDAAGQTIGDYEMFGHYRAILGVGMRTSTTSAAIGNPIAQLPGSPAFVVRAQGHGDAQASLDIGPTIPEAFNEAQLPPLAAGESLENAVDAWDDRTVPACIAELGPASASYCGGAILDTGCPSTKIEWTTYTGAQTTWASGTEVDVSLGALDEYAFEIGVTPTPGIDEVIVESQPQTAANMINLGTKIFFRDDVLFDQRRGVIGVAPHAAITAARSPKP